MADTFETAKAAADAVRVTYAKEKPNVETDLKADDEPDQVVTTFGMRHRLESQRGDAEAAFASAPVKLDQTYVTPAETHNPLELHATTAIWEGSQADAVRVVAGSRQPPQRARADVRLAEGERPRHHANLLARVSAASCGHGRNVRSPPPRRGSSASRSNSWSAAR